MIDLTPLDVRSKRGDFKRLMRGYDPQEVDTFLELVAERLEQLTRENIGLRERSQTLQQQVSSQAEREQAVQDALVTAQELRADIRGQAQREAQSVLKEAETEGRRLIAEAEAEARTRLRASERRLDQISDSLQEMERRRGRFLREFRQLLERELDVVQVEEDRKPLEERTIDLELGARWAADKDAEAAENEGESGSEASPDAAIQAKGSPGAPPVEAGGKGLKAPDDVPPADAAIDELAAAYERAQKTDEGSSTQSALGQALDAAPPAPKGKKVDNLMLYLDPDEET